MKALILVDLQNDFFPNGALEVKGGTQVLPAVNALLKEPFDLIIATKDFHPPNHVSFATTHGKNPGDRINYKGIEQILWPLHCVANTPGSDFAPGWDISKVDIVIHKGDNPDTDSYSTFFDNGHTKSTGLEEILRKKGIDTVYIAGLATDYCVKYSAFDAINLGFKTYIVKDGCKGVNLKPGDEERAFQEMSGKGALLI